MYDCAKDKDEIINVICAMLIFAKKFIQLAADVTEASHHPVSSRRISTKTITPTKSKSTKQKQKNSKKGIEKAKRSNQQSRKRKRPEKFDPSKKYRFKRFFEDVTSNNTFQIY